MWVVVKCPEKMEIREVARLLGSLWDWPKHWEASWGEGGSVICGPVGGALRSPHTELGPDHLITTGLAWESSRLRQDNPTGKPGGRRPS